MRTQTSIVLIRLDLAGTTHRNPDGELIPCPHLHRYKEGFGDRWAMPIPEDLFKQVDNIIATMYDFADYCHVVQLPQVIGGLL